MDHDRIHRVMSGDDRSTSAAMLRVATAVGEPFYRLGTAARNAMFDRGLRRPTCLPSPTISVGNITTGGTGKTPVVAYIARKLVEIGRDPAILSRGYHGGDEAKELADLLGDRAVVVANPDRVLGAKLARDQLSGIDVFLLDDGFQHRQVARDLDLVLIDATRPFGFGHVLPRGLLREPIGNLKRADAVIVTRTDQVSDEALRGLDRQIERYTDRPPIAHAIHRWENTDQLAGKAVLGVCGIGNPRAFGKTLQRHAGGVIDNIVFDDHHDYTREELSDLFDRAARDHADAVVTTEKDYVKWIPLLEQVTPPIPIIRPRLTIGFPDGADKLDAIVRDTVESSKRQN